MLEFKHNGKSVSEKTDIWIVVGNGHELGRIGFFGRWRKYCFFPSVNTLFDNKCLNEISDFCKKQTDIVFKRNKD